MNKIFCVLHACIQLAMISCCFHGLCKVMTIYVYHVFGFQDLLGNLFYTSLRKGDSHLKHNSLVSTTPCLTPTCTLSPSHTSLWPLVGHYPPQPGLYSDPPPTPSPSSLMAQAIFEPNLFLFTPQQLTNLVQSTHTYLPMKMEQTECSKTSAFKTQKPVNYPKVIIQHSKHGESFKSRTHSNSVKLEVLHTFWMFSMAFCTSCWHSSTKPMFNRRRALISMCSHLLIPLNLQKRHQKLPFVGLLKNAFSAVLVSLCHMECYVSDELGRTWKAIAIAPFKVLSPTSYGRQNIKMKNINILRSHWDPCQFSEVLDTSQHHHVVPTINISVKTMAK